MSAYLVSEAHIAALVDAMLYGPAGARGHWSQVYDESAEQFRERPEDTPDDLLGRLLWLENARSVGYRYPNDPAEVPRFYRTGRVVIRRPTVVEVLKHLACYEYQSCEHPAWEQSTAAALCTRLRLALISHLPGYEAAPWGL